MSRNKIVYNKCVVCGKQLTRNQKYYRQQCCSKECSAKNPFRKKKMKDTIKDKYGCQHYSQTEEFKNKVKQSWNNKSIEQIEQINNKLVKTNLQKYGVERPLQNKQILQKMIETNLQRYGVQNYSQTEQFLQKFEKTCLQKYFVNNLMQDDEIRNKSVITRNKKTYNQLKQRFENFVIPLFTQEEYKGKNISYKWKCKKCGNQFQQHIHKTQFDGEVAYIPRCLNCYPYVKGFSYAEKQIVDYIKTFYQGNVEEHNRIVLDKKQLDIYLSELNLAIQFNGSFWHSFNWTKDKYNLSNKKELCKKKNIRLINIFEHQWKNQKQIVKSLLKRFIEDKEIVFQKSHIQQITEKECNEFLEKYHLKGKKESCIRIGCFEEEQLVAVMTFDRMNQQEYEITRFVSIRNTSLYEMLIEFFQKKYKPESIVVTVDRCWQDEEMFQKIGFEQIKIIQPNCFYLKNNKQVGECQIDQKTLKIYDCGKVILKKKF